MILFFVQFIDYERLLFRWYFQRIISHRFFFLWSNLKLFGSVSCPFIFLDSLWCDFTLITRTHLIFKLFHLLVFNHAFEVLNHLFIDSFFLTVFSISASLGINNLPLFSLISVFDTWGRSNLRQTLTYLIYCINRNVIVFLFFKNMLKLKLFKLELLILMSFLAFR